jgi:ABC-type Fe3+-hydroxamate transport system substrate-binding protein
MRIVSLVPSVTETLSAWGVEPIACTRFCERPDLPHVGGTKNPDIEAIIGLAPDLVVVDQQENRREDADALSAAGLRVLALDVRSVDDLAVELAPLAEAVGINRLDLTVPEVAPLHLSAFVPIWRRPWMTIGGRTYGSEVLSRLGITNVYDDDAVDYPQVDLAAVSARAPDLVLVPSEPYEFTDTHLNELRVVAPVVRVDGQDLFWWGARTRAAIDRLHSTVSLRLG